MLKDLKKQLKDNLLVYSNNNYYYYFVKKRCQDFLNFQTD